jgi:hypothetical protein
LGAIQRLSNRFQIYSRTGAGTVVWSQLRSGGDEPFRNGEFQVGGVSIALAGEEVCGDAWGIRESPGRLMTTVVDGLGHGIFAQEAAHRALAVFATAKEGLSEMLQAMHDALKRTRGAAAAIVDLRASSREVVSGGVGNISMRLLTSAGSNSLISENGTLGCNVRRMREEVQLCQPGTLLVMHSDGLSANWDLASYPGLCQRHPAVIAAVLYRDCKRSRDDATVVVARVPDAAS